MIECLCIFVYILTTSSSPESRTIESISWLKFFLDSMLQYQSVEHLMDFLMFLVEKVNHGL